jgi:hypothetical protein
MSGFGSDQACRSARPYTLRRFGREWLIAFLSYALLVAPFGCQFQSAVLDGSGTGTDTSANLGPTSVGLFVNDDLTSPVVAAARNAAGDAFFVYGTRTFDGGLGEVSEILVETAAGQQSFIKFDKGRPVRLQGPDGSNLQIAYTQITPIHLIAQAAAFDPNGTQLASQTADIDLTQTAQQVAQMVQSVTGQTVPVPSSSNVHADPNATAKLWTGETGNSGAGGTGTAKTLDRGQRLLMALTVALALVAFSQLLILTSGQTVNHLFSGLGELARAAVLVIFSPVILFAEILSAVSQHVFATPLIRIFVQLPPAP